MLRVLKPGGWALVNIAALDLLRGSHSTLTMERRRYTPASLKRLLTGAGFVVKRLTFTNMATFPVTLAVRLGQRLTGRADTASESDLPVPPAPVNGVFNAMLAVEAGLLRAREPPNRDVVALPGAEGLRPKSPRMERRVFRPGGNGRSKDRPLHSSYRPISTLNNFRPS